MLNLLSLNYCRALDPHSYFCGSGSVSFFPCGKSSHSIQAAGLTRTLLYIITSGQSEENLLHFRDSKGVKKKINIFSIEIELLDEVLQHGTDRLYF